MSIFRTAPPEEVAASPSRCRAGATAGVRIDARLDGRGNPYYWIAFDRETTEPPPGTDLEALRSKRISVTPLRLDLTDEASLARYARLFN